MPVPKLYPEEVVARFEKGALEQIKSVLRDDETRAEFIRTVVGEEIMRRRTAARCAAEIAQDSGASPTSAEPSEQGATDGQTPASPPLSSG